ncbi:hypothetical protein BD289DRAFT_74241 [Coniella lustricola]|uniref:Secreted protein n=1 Tax=Coniella lustricola TaxID=2025994 RepID=A0A2T3AHR1_9PEZI|nr:hypothetical protein BD289DRAFT_74241 [Coniella lustricola]
MVSHGLFPLLVLSALLPVTSIFSWPQSLESLFSRLLAHLTLPLHSCKRNNAEPIQPRRCTDTKYWLSYLGITKPKVQLRHVGISRPGTMAPKPLTNPATRYLP